MARNKLLYVYVKDPSLSSSHLQNRMKNICVIGAGPAGFYTSRRLLKAGHRVFMLEKSRYPFGLASQGIALDNQELKTVVPIFLLLDI